MASRLSPAVLTAAVLLTASGAFGQAVPGAQGFGGSATGGRGGDVYHVTTLADDPNHAIPGSLFYGLYEKNVPAAGRTIVFDVGGTIQLGSTTLDIKNVKNVTIAGQTAPSPITIIGNTVQVTSSSGKETGNIILQHVAIRKGLANSGDALTIKGSGNTHDILVDHVSGSWSEDEVISVAGATNHSNNVTVQYSTMSEALTAGHQYGALIRNDSSAAVSYLHNLFSNNVSRNPRPGTYLGTQLDFEFQNNVIYNWQDRAGYTGGASETDTENVNMNYVGNYLIAGPSTVGGPTLATEAPVTGARRNTAFTKDISNAPKDPLNLKFYQEANKIDWSAGPTRDGQDLGWGAFAVWNGTTSSAFPDADKVSKHAYPAANGADPADDAYAKVLASVGAFPWARTTTDQRLVNEVLTYTGSSGLTAPNTAEWDALTSAAMTTRAANWDTDQDGMPDAWEALHGTNPAVADNNGLMPNNLTNLENYLRALSLQAAWGNDAGGAWSAYLNWRGIRPGEADATATFGNVITAPRTVTIDAPVTLGQIAFDSVQSYTLSGTSTLTLDVVAGTATVDVTTGSHAINALLQLLKPTRFTVTPADGVLTVTALQDSNVALSKAGGGTLAMNPAKAASLTISQGRVALVTGAGPSAAQVNSLVIASGSTLDLGSRGLIVQTADASSKAAALSTLAARIISAKAGGDWSGDGLTSSAVATDPSHDSTVGLFDNADLALGSFGGRGALNANSLLVSRAIVGDANLDNNVDLADYDRWYSHVGGTGNITSHGDFNMDNNIDLADYDLWYAHVGASLAVVPESSFSTVAVPEPASLAALALGALLAARRRCRG